MVSKRKLFALAALLGFSLLSTFSCCAAIHGIVSNAVTHRPVGGVELAAVSFGFSPPITVASTVSASDGSYTLEFRSGRYPVFASALGYADYSDFNAPGSGTYNIALTPVAVISGTVFDPDSQPIPYANVLVIDAATGGFLTDIVGDQYGNFVLNGIDPGSYMLCVISAYDDYRDGCYDNQPIGADGIPHGTPVNVASGRRITGLNIHLQTGATISGTLTDRMNHAPIYNLVRFMFYTPAGVLATSVDLTSDEAGVYRIPGLAPGSYYLVASQGFSSVFQFYPHVYGGNDCDVTDPRLPPACSFVGVTPLIVPQQGLTDIDFELSGGGFAGGRVTDAATGLGIAGVQLNACTPPDYYPTAGAMTDASGYYNIPHVLPHFVVATRASGYMDQLWPHSLYEDSDKCIPRDPQSFLTLPTLTASLSGIDFSLNKGSHVSGTVSGTQGLAAHIAFFRWDLGVLTLIENVAANAEGSFETEDITTTDYYKAVAYLDDGVTCTVYGGSPCGPAWQASDPSSADFSDGGEFLIAPGVVILNLDFQMIFDHVFSNGFEGDFRPAVPGR